MDLGIHEKMEWVAIKPCGCITAAYVDGDRDNPDVMEIIGEWRVSGRRAERRPIAHTKIKACTHDAVVRS